MRVMVKNFEQAKKIQAKRVLRGQVGHSKAVRRYLKRGKNLRFVDDYEMYLTDKFALPHMGDIGHGKNADGV
jgi:hypothetical protein